MSKLYNVSSSPHVRSKLTTGIVMYDVILCLLPATVMGIWHFKLQALMVIAASIVSAMLAEFVFDYIAHRKNTLTDGSAIVTGLLLALCLPASVPLYIPCLGAVFAIIVADWKYQWCYWKLSNCSVYRWYGPVGNGRNHL